MIDSKQQRLNMVECQVRPSDVTDRRIIRAMLEIPREAFVAPALHTVAYMDEAVPVARDCAGKPTRTLLAPRALAKLIQACEIEPTAAVLDVGCATGYSTAVLAHLAASVVGVEVDQGLASQATQVLGKLAIGNATVICGPLEAGAPEQAPFDAILLNGAVEEMPQALLDQLKDGGRLLAIVAGRTFGKAQVWRRQGKTFDARPVFDCGALLLPGFARRVEFAL
jgi:protein-L-isoaspartate(D-aspartate) O-methyltransferase